MLGLKVSTKPIKRSFGLSLGHSSHQGTADYRTHWSQRRAEFVAIVKPCVVFLGLEYVLRSSTRPCRSTALPHGQLADATLDQSPVNLEVDASHVDLLIHLIADSRGALVGVQQPAVNG